MLKVYINNDKIYCHKVNEQDNQYDMAISPYWYEDNNTVELGVLK